MKYKLIDLLDFKTQGVNTTTDHISYVEKGYKIVQAKNIAPYNITFDESNFVDEETFSRIKDNHKLHKGEVLYTNIGSQLGNSAIYEFDDEAIITWNVMKLIPNKDIIDNYYLCYLLNSNKPYIKALNTSSTMPFVSGKALMNVEFEVPDLRIQKKVIKVLKNIEDKIKLNNEINNNLRELCKTNYLRIIEENSVEISLSELMDYQGGSQPPASEFQKEKNENNIRFVQIRDFETDSYICYIPNSNKNKLCNKDDILIARYGASLGRICYGLSGAYNVALAKALPKKAEYKELLRVILESDDFYNYINQVGQRSAQAGFNAGDIAGYTVIIPNENGLKVFNSISKNVIDKRLLMIEENRKLSELRDTLLPKLMNGEIDLDNIEI